MSWHMDDIATGKHILHALAAGYVQSFFFDYLLELMGAPTWFSNFIYNDDILQPASIKSAEMKSE